MHVSCVDWFHMFLLSLCGITTCTHMSCAKLRTQQMCRGTILPFVNTWVQVQRKTLSKYKSVEFATNNHTQGVWGRGRCHHFRDRKTRHQKNLDSQIWKRWLPLT